MRNLLHCLGCLPLVSGLACGRPGGAETGWTSLFDGKALDHWKRSGKLNPPSDGWTIEDSDAKHGPLYQSVAPYGIQIRQLT